MTRLSTVLAILATAGLAHSQPLYIVGGEVHTVAGPVEVATVVVRDGLIESVEPGLQPPAGARVFDAEGMVVTPGLVDYQTQLGLTEI